MGEKFGNLGKITVLDDDDDRKMAERVNVSMRKFMTVKC